MPTVATPPLKFDEQLVHDKQLANAANDMTEASTAADSLRMNIRQLHLLTRRITALPTGKQTEYASSNLSINDLLAEIANETNQLSKNSHTLSAKETQIHHRLVNDIADNLSSIISDLDAIRHRISNAKTSLHSMQSIWKK